MRPTRWPRRRMSRNPLGAVASLVAIAVIAGVVGLVFAPPTTHAGRAYVTDGDSLRIGEARIRLVGLDAVELAQSCERNGEEWACGREARDFLVGLIGGREIKCASDRRDQYGRSLAHCSLDDADIGDAIVRSGWAVAELEYALAVADARSNSRGIWAGSFADPADFRRENEAVQPGFWDWLLSVLPH